jgi:hypothetical protein
MNKKAISDIVSTVLIIMIAVAAVGIIGAFVIPMIRDSLGLGQTCNSVISDLYIDGSSGFSCIDLEKDVISIQIKKGPEDIEYAGIKLSAIDKKGNSRPFYIASSFEKTGLQTFYLYRNSTEELESIELIPIIRQGEKIRECESTSSIKLSQNCNLKPEILDSRFFYVDYIDSKKETNSSINEIKFSGSLLDLINAGSKNLIDPLTWKEGQGNVADFGTINGGTNENYRIYGQDPWGIRSIIWEARPGPERDADGGWEGFNFSIDNTKLYRFSVWVNRKILGTDGRFYFGTRGIGTVNGVGMLDGATTEGNPYFFSSRILPVDEWILVVGHVFPHSYSGVLHSESGRYFLNGTKITTGHRDFKWLPTSTSSRHRSYLYYTTDTSVRQQWIYPRVDVIDGTEPSIQDLLNGYDSLHYYLSR